MKKLIINASLTGLGFLVLGNSAAYAGVITGGNLLTNDYADQLEIWLGSGDQDFNNVWSGDTGATATSWHTAVDGIGPTISIYDITYDGTNYLIGGFTERDWGEYYSYKAGTNEFIFNLTSNVKEDLGTYPQYATYSNPSYFATFGGGHDIFGGINEIGERLGYAYQGYSYGNAFNSNIVIGGSNFTNFTVNRLETYTFANAQSVESVPEPLTILGSLAAIGFGTLFKKKKLSSKA